MSDNPQDTPVPSGGGASTEAVSFATTGGSYTQPVLKIIPPFTIDAKGVVISAPGLWTAADLGAFLNGVESLNFNNIVGIDNGLALGGESPLVSFDPGILAVVTGALWLYLPTTATLSIPNLKYVGSDLTINCNNNAIDLSALEVVVGSIVIGSYATSPSSIDMSSIKYIGGNFTASGCAFSEANVDAILALLASLNGTNGTVSYSGLTVNLAGGNAPPSAIGLAHKAMLEARGCTVTVNT